MKLKQLQEASYYQHEPKGLGFFTIHSTPFEIDEGWHENKHAFVYSCSEDEEYGIGDDDDEDDYGDGDTMYFARLIGSGEAADNIAKRYEGESQHDAMWGESEYEQKGFMNNLYYEGDDIPPEVLKHFGLTIPKEHQK